MEENKQSLQMLRVKDLIKLFGVTKPTIHRWIDNGTLPKPARLGKVIAWKKTVIDEWIASNTPETEG